MRRSSMKIIGSLDARLTLCPSIKSRDRSVSLCRLSSSHFRLSRAFNRRVFVEAGVPRHPGNFSPCSARLLPIYRVRHARISPRSNREPVIVPLISRLTPRNRNSFRGQALSIRFIVTETVTAGHVPPVANRVRCTLRRIPASVHLRYRILRNLVKSIGTSLFISFVIRYDLPRSNGINTARFFSDCRVTTTTYTVDV